MSRDMICRNCGEFIQQDFREDDRGWSEALPPIEVDAYRCPYCNPDLQFAGGLSKEEKAQAFKIVKESLDEMVARFERKTHYK